MKKVPENLRRGALGEDYTARRLIRAGYEILARNYRCPYGEIDIIACRGEILAFVEVKTRSKTAWYSPGTAVTASKQKKIICTAQWYLTQFPRQLQPRFDVAEVYLKDGGAAVERMRYLENAFDEKG